MKGLRVFGSSLHQTTHVLHNLHQRVESTILFEDLWTVHSPLDSEGSPAVPVTRALSTFE